MVENVHVLDPTDRTVDTVHREIEQLEDKFSIEMSHQKAIGEEKHRSVQTQFDLMESHRLEREGSAEAHRIELKADNQRTVETAMTAAEKAVQAALAAAEKARDQQTIATNLANTKSENTMIEALKQMAGTFTASLESVVTQLGNVKEIALGADQFRKGGLENHTEKRSDLAVMVQILAISAATFIGLCTIGLGLYFGLHK